MSRVFHTLILHPSHSNRACRHYFAVSTDPSEQLHYLACLISWLAGITGKVGPQKLRLCRVYVQCCSYVLRPWRSVFTSMSHPAMCCCVYSCLYRTWHLRTSTMTPTQSVPTLFTQLKRCAKLFCIDSAFHTTVCCVYVFLSVGIRCTLLHCTGHATHSLPLPPSSCRTSPSTAASFGQRH